MPNLHPDTVAEIARHLAVARIQRALRGMRYDHLPPALREISMPCAELAVTMAHAEGLDLDELADGLEFLRSAKDRFVAAAAHHLAETHPEESRNIHPDTWPDNRVDTRPDTAPDTDVPTPVTHTDPQEAPELPEQGTPGVDTGQDTTGPHADPQGPPQVPSEVSFTRPSGEHVTVVPAEVYEEMTSDRPEPEPERRIPSREELRQQIRDGHPEGLPGVSVAQREGVPVLTLAEVAAPYMGYVARTPNGILGDCPFCKAVADPSSGVYPFAVRPGAGGSQVFQCIPCGEVGELAEFTALLRFHRPAVSADAAATAPLPDPDVQNWVDPSSQ